MRENLIQSLARGADLTEPEAQVMELLAQGLTERRIARRLKIHPAQVTTLRESGQAKAEAWAVRKAQERWEREPETPLEHARDLIEVMGTGRPSKPNTPEFARVPATGELMPVRARSRYPGPYDVLVAQAERKKPIDRQGDNDESDPARNALPERKAA